MSKHSRTIKLPFAGTVPTAGQMQEAIDEFIGLMAADGKAVQDVNAKLTTVVVGQCTVFEVTGTEVDQDVSNGD